jgi:hypothetical protein
VIEVTSRRDEKTRTLQKRQECGTRHVEQLYGSYAWIRNRLQDAGRRQVGEGNLSGVWAAGEKGGKIKDHGLKNRGRGTHVLLERCLTVAGLEADTRFCL